MSQRSTNSLLLLAGSTEAGKSTAGAALATLGATRLKIRELIVRLNSGVETISVGALTRVGFEKQEFFALLAAERPFLKKVTVLESLIDPTLAEWLKSVWQYGACYTVFIDAPVELRVSRLAAFAGITLSEAQTIVSEKDRAKGLPGTLEAWRALADKWIYNDSSLETFLAQLYDVYNTLNLDTNTR